MAVPGGNSLLNGGLLSAQSPQHSTEQHFAMYATNLVPVQSSSCLAQQLGKTESVDCDAFCQPLHHSFLTDFSDVQDLPDCGDVQQFQDLSGHLVCNGSVAGGNGIEDRVSARRVHKADREKLRRDKLNEQFSELATALDPERPKNDKATILGDSVQVVKDLREEVKRLKTEHASLLNESRDLTQEKTELREEKAALKNDTEQLQSQLQQRLRASSPWMALDPSVMMGAAAFPYPVPVPQPVSLSQSDSHQVVPPPRALVTPTPYIPLPAPMGAFHMHPSLQAYAMFGNRHGDGGNPYLPYPSFPQPVSSHSHIERPYAQYPSPIQPISGYVVQMQHGQVSQPQPSSGTPVYRPCVPGIPVLPAQNHGSSQRKGSSNHLHASQGSSQHLPTELQPHAPCSTASQSQLQASGSAVIPDTRAEPVSFEAREDGSIVHQSKDSSTTCFATTTSNSSKENLSFPLDHGGLLLDTQGNKIVEKESIGSGDSLEVKLEQLNDPTLRPPAA